MTPAQRAAGWVIALAIGLSVAWYAYQRVSDPVPRQQRLQEEEIVMRARTLLAELVADDGNLEIADPLQKNRVAGKVYIYPFESGWQVSGHYRRQQEVLWQPWLMTLDGNGVLVDLSIQDPALRELAARDARVRFKAPE